MEYRDIHIISDHDRSILYHVPTATIMTMSNETANNIKNNMMEHDNNAKLAIEYLKEKEEIHIERECFQKLDRMGTLLFASSEKCNLKCKYCFANEGTYDNPDGRIITFEEYKKYIEYVLKYYPDGVDVICFFGGEPMLAYGEIKKFIIYCDELFNERKIKPPIYSTVTNGTIFNDEMVEFFNEYNVSVTVSIDGTKELNDYGRISRDGKSVYDKVAQNLKHIQNKRKFHIAGEVTINKGHIDNYYKGIGRELIDTLYNLGLDVVMLGTVDSKNSDLEIKNEDEPKLRAFYEEIIEHCFELLLDENNYEKFPWDYFNIIRGITTKSYHRECQVGKKSLFITSNGEVYPCQLFYQARKYSLRTVNDNYYDSIPKIIDITKNADRLKISKCKECEARYLCDSWCPGSSMAMNGCIDSVINSRCLGTKITIDSIIKNLVKVRENKDKYNVFVEHMKKIEEKYNKNNMLNRH